MLSGSGSKKSATACGLLLPILLWLHPDEAAPVSGRFMEGAVHGFLVLGAINGDAIASGDLRTNGSKQHSHAKTDLMRAVRIVQCKSSHPAVFTRNQDVRTWTIDEVQHRAAIAGNGSLRKAYLRERERSHITCVGIVLTERGVPFQAFCLPKFQL